MGLGTKIKEALSSDHHDNATSNTSPTTSKHTTSTNTNYNTPGSFPSDDVSHRHTDGKEYTPPHGTALSDAKWKETGAQTGAHTGTHTGATTGTGLSSSGAHTGTHTGATTGTGLSSSGTQRNRLSKSGNEYDAPYDAESSPRLGHHTQGSPKIGHHAQDTSAVNPNISRTTADKDHSSNSPTGAYWGDLSQGGHGAGTTTHGIPERTRAGEGLAGSNGTHTGHHMPRDEAVGGGTYNANAGHIGSTNRDPTESSHFGDEFSSSTGHYQTGTTGNRDHLAGSSGAGIHNPSSLSSGTQDQFGSRTGQSTGTGHNPLSSGNNYDQQNTGYRGDSLHTSPTDLHTSPTDRTSHGQGHGLAGAGAAAGVGAAAGYGAHEYGRNNQTHSGHTGSGSLGSDGVPRSSMLDPEPALGNTSHTRTGVPHTGAGYNTADSSTGGYTGTNDPEGTHGPHSSRIANAADPRVDSDRDHRGVGSSGLGSTGQHASGQQFSGTGSNINTGSHNSSPGLGSSSSPTQGGLGASGSGRKHFGPGHDGAKVMHSCDHCGKDNDISHYFSKDVVYRLGQ